MHLLTYGAPSILGAQGNRHADVGRFGVSDDGRYVVFASAANNLMADDRGELDDVYLSDLQTGALTRISRRPDGGEPNGASFSAAISGDGRWIAYISRATDMGPAAAPCEAFGACAAYLFDRQSGETRLLTPSVLPSSSSVPAEIKSVVLSAAGEYVAIVTDASIDALDTDASDDVYIWSRASGSLLFVSTDGNGNPLPGQVGAASVALSATGQQLSFSMRADPDVAQSGGVYVRDFQASTVDRITQTLPNTTASTTDTDLSADGRLVAFSTGDALLPSDTNGAVDVYLFDRETRAFEAVSVATGGVLAVGGRSERATISADGRYLAFRSEATNFEAGVSGSHIWRRDRISGTTTRVTNFPGVPGSQNWHEAPALSRASGRVLFTSSHEGLVAGDSNRRRDVFAVDPDGTTRRVSQGATAYLAGMTDWAYGYRAQGMAVPLGDSGRAVFVANSDNISAARGGGVFQGGVGAPPLVEIPVAAFTPYVDPQRYSLTLAGASADGSRLVVRREAFSLNSNALNYSEPWDLWYLSTTGQVRIDDPAGVGAGRRTTQALLSDDGQTAVFLSSPALPGGGTGVPQLFMYQADTGLVTRIDVTDQGVPVNSPIQSRIGLSRNGRYTALVTAAGNLVAADADNSVDLFLRDNQTGQFTRLRDPQTGAPLMNQYFGTTQVIAVSDDGNVVAFAGLVPDDNEEMRLSVLDRSAAQLTVLCADRRSEVVRCGNPSMSADGQVVAFVALEALLPSDTDDRADIYSYRRDLGWLQQESLDIHGQGGRRGRAQPRLSASGNTLVFEARGSGWTTSPQTTGDRDWLMTQVEADLIYADGFGNSSQ